MATITSLDFNIASSWDGSGVRKARNDLDDLSADLRRISETRATAQVGVSINRSELDNVRAELQQIDDMNVTAHVGVTIDRSGLDSVRNDLRSLGEEHVSATVGLNVDRGNFTQLTRDLEQFGHTRYVAEASVNVDDARFQELRRDLELFGHMRYVANVDIDVSTAGARLHELELRLRSAGGAAGGLGGAVGGLSAPMGSASSASSGLSGSMGGLTTAVGYLVLALVAIGPASALATAALLGGLGVAVIGLGALALSGTAQVKAAFKGLTSSLKSEMTQAAQVMKGPLVEGINQLKVGLKGLQPAFTQAFAAAAPLIKPLVAALVNFAGAVMPGVIAALRAAGPVFEGLRVGAKALGEGVSAMFSGLAKGAAGAGAALGTFLSYAGQILGSIGQAFGQMAAAGSRALGGLMSGLLSLVNGAMKGFVGAVKAMDGSLGPFLATIGKTVGTILQQMLPVFGQMLAVLMQGLMPVLRAITPALVIMGQALGSTIVQALRVLTPLLGSLAKTFASVMISLAPLIPPLTKILIAGLQLMVAVITPLLPLITLLAKGLGLLAPVINVAAIAITAMSKGIQAAITWLSSWQNITAAFAVAWNATWNALKIATLAIWDALKVAWNATVQGLTTAWNATSAALVVAWNAVWNAMKATAQVIWTAMTVAWSAVVTGMTTVWNTLGNALHVAWDATWNAMKVSAQAIWTGLQAAWSAFINTMKSIWDTVSSALHAAWDAVWTAMSGFAKSTWSALQAAWSAFVNAMHSIWNTVSAALHAAWDAVWTAMSGFAKSTWNALQAAWSTFVNAMKSVWNTVSAALHAAWDGVWTAMKGFATSTWNVLGGAWSTFTHAINTVWNAAGGVLKTAWSGVWNTLKSTADTIWGGIKHVVASGVNDVIGIINGIIGAWDTIVGAVGLKKLSIGKITYHANFADGGPVNGPGTGTSDSIPANLSNGEHVWTAAEVSGAGGHGAVARMRSAAMGGAPVRTMGAPNGRWSGFAFASGGGAGDSGGADGGLGSTTDPDTPKGANAAQKAAANVPGVYLKGNNQRIGKDNYNHLTAIQKSIVNAAGVSKVDKSILDQVGDTLKGIGKGAIGGLSDIVKLGVSALGFIGKEVIDHIFAPLIKPLAGDMGAGKVGEFVVDESKNIMDEMVGLLIKKDSDAGSVGGKIPEGQHLAIIDAALKAAGVPPPGSQSEWEAGLNTLITRESGWNSGIVNHWDSNAAAGHPSGGLAQVIGPTFAAYHVAGTSSSLTDPVANVAAAINYIVHRYGNISNVQQANANKPPKGYASGTASASSGLALVGENGPELVNFGGGESVIPNGKTNDIMAGGAGSSALGDAAALTAELDALNSKNAAIWSQVSNVAGNAWSSMQTGSSSFGSSLESGFSGTGSQIASKWAQDWNNAKNASATDFAAMIATSAAFTDGTRKMFQDQGEATSANWKASLDAIKNVTTTNLDSTHAVATTFADNLNKTFTDSGTSLSQDWKTSLDTMGTQSTKFWTDNQTSFSNGATWMTGTFFPPVNDFLTKTFPASFTTGAAAVATGWDGLKQEVYTPVKAIVDTVYNAGIRGVWNVIAGAFGAPTLAEFAMPAFATGGAVNGPGTGTSDSITARLSHGEHVWTAAEVKAAGGHQAVAGIRSGVMGGGQVRQMGTNAFAAGGGVNATGTQGVAATPAPTGGAASGPIPVDLQALSSLTLGNIAGKANPMLDTIAKQGKDAIDAMIPGTPPLESAMNGMIDGMVSSAESWITTNDISFVIGGVNDAAAQAWADSQVGKPYALGGDFVNGIDCSEYQSGIARAILGQTPAPWFTTFAFEGATAPQGFEEGLQAPYMVGITNVGVGHMAGTLNGKNYEATPPAVRSGPSARGYDDGMFTNRYGFRPSIETSVGGVTDANHLAIIDAAMAAAGVPPPDTKAAWENGMNTLIGRESAWDPNAINLTDSNAQAGMPSQGLAQVIPPTFAAYHVAGTSSNILDPIANVAAAINYIVHTYGSIANVQQANPNLPPLGYWKGTKSAHSGWAMVGEHGPEPVNFGGGGQQVRSFKDAVGDIRQSGDCHGGDTDNSVNWHEGSLVVNVNIPAGANAEECKKAVTSEEVLSQLRQAVHAGTGKKVG